MKARSRPAATRAPEDARERLLHAGLRLFAQQGYSKTSTRELAETAQVNIAAISYYFGDKAGLYRAVFVEPVGEVESDLARLTDPTQPLRQALHGFYAAFLEPLRQGDLARLCMKLHLREMVEPTGLWAEAVGQSILPQHQALLLVLCRALGEDEADDDLQRLAVCLVGLAVHIHVGWDITDQIAPSLNQGEEAVDLWTQRLLMYGMAMVQAEADRRGRTLSHGAPA